MDDSLKALIPNRNASMPAVFVNRPMLHPNIYRKRILQTEGNPVAGQWVAVYSVNSDYPDRDSEGRRTGGTRSESEPSLFAYGIYNPRSEVAVRLMSWWGEWPDDAFWDRIVDQAVSLRRDVLRLDETTDAYRVMHGEADGVPGLVVDRYGDCLSASSSVWACRIDARQFWSDCNRDWGPSTG